LIFACHKNVWQSLIFYRFINNRKNKYISKRIIAEWVLYKSEIPLNKVLLETGGFSICNTKCLENVIGTYLSFLSHKGIIRYEVSAYRVNIASYRAAANYVN